MYVKTTLKQTRFSCVFILYPEKSHH